MEYYKPIFLIPFLSLLLFHSLPLSLSTLSPNPSPSPEIPPSASPAAFSPNAEAQTGLESELGPELESQLKAELESETQSFLTSTDLEPDDEFGSDDSSEQHPELESETQSFLTSTEEPDEFGSDDDSSEQHRNLLGGSLLKPFLNNPLINNVCHKTDYPDLCISTIAPMFGRTKCDIYGIIGKAVEATSLLTRKGLRQARKLAAKPGTPPDVAHMLRRCKQSYRDAYDSAKVAMGSLARRDIGSMRTQLSAVVTYVGDCMDVFSGQPSPMAIYDDKVTKMTSNCLAISEVI